MRRSDGLGRRASVLCSSIVIVIGPTPPRGGVSRPATPSAASKSTSPTSLPSTSLTPTSITAAPGLIQSPLHQRGDADRGDQDVGLAARRSARSRVREWHIVTVALRCEQQQRDRLADDACCGRSRPRSRRRAGSPCSVEHLEDAERRAGRRPGSAEQQPSRVQRVQTPSTSLAGSIAPAITVRIDLLRQRQLHQDAVDAGVAVELVDERRARRPASRRRPGCARRIPCRRASHARRLPLM